MIGYYNQIRAAMEGKPKPQKIPGSLFWQSENFGINNISFDLLINETHGAEYEVSEHIIENGDTIADNVRRHLRKVSITGLFTNHGIYSNSDEWVDEDGNLKKGADKIRLNGEPMEENWALEQYERLQAIAAERKPVKLTAALEVYENMIITSLRTSRGPQDGEAIRFEMELQEIKSVALVTSEYDDGTWTPKNQDTAEGRAAAKKKNGGNVTAEEKEAQQMAEELASVNQGQWAQT